MNMRFKSLRKILSMVLCMVLMMTYMPMTAFAADNIVYVSSATGSDSNTGASDAPVKTIEKALELVEENGIIQIVDSASSEQPSEDEPLCITKSITITGGTLTLSRAGIVLGADVTFQNVSLSFANPVRNAIIANGYTLTLVNLKGSGTYPVHLFCGGVTGYTGSGTLPAAGSAGAIVISGTDNSLGNIFAGSLSEYGAENTWTGSSTITIASGAGGEFGSIYAHGATEPRGEGDGSSMTPNSSSYTVTGDVAINLSGSKPAAVYGITGGSSNADVVFSGGVNLISNLVLNNLGSLTVSAGTLQPASLNEDLDLTINSGAELDMSTVIEDNSVFTVGDFTGGGTLSMGREDKLSITGTVTGTTVFQTTDNRPNDKSTSGVVEYSYAYIDVTNANGDGTFTFTPYSSQTAATLEKVTVSDTIVWTTSEAPEYSDVKPDSFDIPTTSYTMSVEGMQSGLMVSVSCELEEDEFFSDVPLNITISKDGGEAISAEESYDEYGYLYSVESLGFENIYGTYGDNGDDWGLYFSSDLSTIKPGTYTISISVALSDNSTATRVITLVVNTSDCVDDIGAELAGYTLSLNGNIGVNFYMELSDTIVNDNGAYMQFTLPNGSTKQAAVENADTNTTITEGKTYYVFSCEVASYDMAGDIKAQMFDGNGKSGAEYSYSVRDYAEYIIENAASYTSDDVAFVKALLNYGACSQTYFEKTTDDLANKNLAVADQTVETLSADSLSSYKAETVSNELGIFDQYNLVLNSETTLKAYFKPADGVEISSLTFSVDGQTVTPVQSGEYYVLSMENIKAWDLDTNYTFKVSAGSTALEFSCSTLAYGYSVLDKGNSVYSDKLIQLISALRVYQQKAEVYASGNN